MRCFAANEQVHAPLYYNLWNKHTIELGKPPQYSHIGEVKLERGDVNYIA